MSFIRQYPTQLNSIKTIGIYAFDIFYMISIIIIKSVLVTHHEHLNGCTDFSVVF